MSKKGSIFVPRKIGKRTKMSMAGSVNPHGYWGLAVWHMYYISI